MEIKRISIDTSKHVFTLHGVDAQERPVLRRELRRSQIAGFFEKLSATEVVLEACAGSHHWGRLLTGMGHRVKLIPPQYVKPFVKRSKNDRNDAEAICEAASRPTMRTVPVKTLDEQAATIILRHRDLLLGQRTQTINALRGHAAEFGIVAAKGEAHIKALLAAVAAANDVPMAAQAMLARMGQHIADLNAKIAELDRELSAVHKANPISQRLAAVPGVGPITAVTMALSINAEHFQSGRHFAAWLGLTPQEHSTGGKQRLGRISKAGNERMRQLLVLGAMAVISSTRATSRSASAWLLQLLERRPRKVAAVALANKIARVIWAMLARGETYRHSPVPV